MSDNLNNSRHESDNDSIRAVIGAARRTRNDIVDESERILSASSNLASSTSATASGLGSASGGMPGLASVGSSANMVRERTRNGSGDMNFEELLNGIVDRFNSFVDRVIDAIEGLNIQQKRVLLTTVIIYFGVKSIGISKIVILFVLAALLSVRKPSKISFFVFFEQWFKNVYYPQVDARIQQELGIASFNRTRSADSVSSSSSSSGTGSSLLGRAFAWVAGRTRDAAASIQWEIIKNRMVVHFKDYGFIVVAVANIGTIQDPVEITFWVSLCYLKLFHRYIYCLIWMK